MKKLIASTVAGVSLLALTATSYAQGEFQFQNNTSSSPVIFGATVASINAGAVGQRVFVSANLGQLEYGVYVGAAGSTSFSQLSLFDTTLAPNVAQGNSFAGLINGGAAGTTGTVITGNGNVAGSGITLNAGTTYVVEVAAWTHADGASLAGALNGASDPNLLVGSSGLGSIVATTTPTPIAQLFGTGAGQLGGFSVNTVPEPTTIALGGLGAAALLFYRRRK